MTHDSSTPAHGETEHAATCEHSLPYNFDCANDCGVNGCLYLRWQKSFADFNQARLDAIKQRIAREQEVAEYGR